MRKKRLKDSEMGSQPSVNIGMVGHVDHGKSTLTNALTGIKTDTHSEEIKRGISIKLGYADTEIYKCADDSGNVFYSRKNENSNCKESRSISIVDAPGHETLMATMLAGSSIMNGALLVIAANEKCPQPQTREHLTALEIMGIKDIVVAQNKIDLVTRERAMESYDEIKRFLKGSVAEDAPIIPVSAYHNVNIDALLQAIETRIPTPKFDPGVDPMMYVARSFDVNKPGTDPARLVGGVLGGSLVRGELVVGQEIEITPGLQITKGNKQIWENIITEVVSLRAGNSSLDRIRPGGLAAVGTKLDPFLTKNDQFTGKIIGNVGKAPPMVTDAVVETHLLKRVVGFAVEQSIRPIKSKESLMLTVGTANTVAVVSSARKDDIEVNLRYPVAANLGDRVAIGRRIMNRWRLIGYGELKSIA